MIFKAKHSAISTILAMSFLIFNITEKVNAQSKLKIKGRIVMFDNLPKGLQFHYAGLTQTSIVKISKVLQGKELAQYIILLGSTKNGENYSLKSDINKIFKFSLNRASSCDEKIQNLMNINVKNERGELIRTIPRFEISSEIHMGLIPMTETLPCYLISH